MQKLNTPQELCAVKLIKYDEIYGEPLLLELWHNESKALKMLKGEYTVNAFDIIEKKPHIYVIKFYFNGVLYALSGFLIYLWIYIFRLLRIYVMEVICEKS